MARCISPARLAQTAADTPWFKDLYDLFAPVREEAQEHSAEEIDQAIDRAVASARTTRPARQPADRQSSTAYKP